VSSLADSRAACPTISSVPAQHMFSSILTLISMGKQFDSDREGCDRARERSRRADHGR